MPAKVDSVLLFGAMFLSLAEGAVKSVDELQVELERSMLGAPAWVSAVQIRAIAGWSWTWGEQVQFEAIAFRAELWCTKSDMLVRRVWDAAQEYPGRTFAWASRQALTIVGFPEIFDFQGWSEYLEHGASSLPQYKESLKAKMVADSVLQWRSAMRRCTSAPPWIMAQQYPISAGERLLEQGCMADLFHADRWDELRLGLAGAATLSASVGGRRMCKLCMSGQASMAHILATCTAVGAARQHYLHSLSGYFSARLREAPAGDWPTLVLSPHSDLEVLRCSVFFGAAIMEALRKAS